jgi:hypothetical protein
VPGGPGGPGAEHQDRHVVVGGLGAEVAHRALDTGRHRQRAQAAAGGQHLGQAVVVVEQPASVVTPLGYPVGDGE